MVELESDYNKVILLGDMSVGKTSLIKVATNQAFDPNYKPTLVSSYVKKEFKYNDKEYTFNIWDTIGQEKYRALTKLYFKKAIIVILVYDITKQKSFEALNYWHGLIKNELVENSYILAIVGNKKDLYEEEKVSEEQGKKYAEDSNAKFKLTSAKDDPNGFRQFLDELFTDYIEIIENKSNKKNKNHRKSSKVSLKSNANEDKKKKKCC